MSEFNVEKESALTFQRILPRLEEGLKKKISADPQGWKQFRARLEKHFPTLFELYVDLYGHRYDFLFHFEDLLLSLAVSWFERSADLRKLDRAREKNPLWFQSNQMLGGVCYVDLFAGSLRGVQSKIPYFKELGLTYLHLMPFFKAPEKENDGGYAVSSYREVEPYLGTMKELAGLARELRKAGISLVVDLVFNHTSNEHDWAKKARAGDEEFMDYYRIFPDREMPDTYERSLRDIFPEEHHGAFTPFHPTKKNILDGWVWTTFHAYQWDLNYANPIVFNRMAGEMLFLANQGVEVIRLDAVAFIWKELGTACENLPQAHELIKAFNAVARIASPALIFKSEAIVHPDDVVKYISPEECQLSYNPLLMALLWNSLATRKVRLLSHSLAARFQIHPQTAWVNYVRVHDDIGWTFSDEDAALLGVNGRDHRKFLNDFYTGRFGGSFARGLPFQENPATSDCRINGTAASLAGLEKAIHEEGPEQIELAIRRILLMYGIVMTIGGIPLVYLGDEIGTLNDYGYEKDPAHAKDSRWVHRPRANWKKYENRFDDTSIEGRVFSGFKRLIQLRKKYLVFSSGNLTVLQIPNEHVLVFQKELKGKKVLVVSNFSEQEQRLDHSTLSEIGLNQGSKKHLGQSQWVNESMTLAPLAFCVYDI